MSALLWRDLTLALARNSSRKRKGRDIHGWMVIDKPAGMTSTAVVNKVRWALEAKKAGHAGTLEPQRHVSGFA